MDFERIIEKEHKYIETKAEKEKQKVIFIVNLFKNNYELVLNSVSHDENLSEKKQIDFLYKKFINCIYDTNKFSFPGGHFIKGKKPDSLAIRIGWIESVLPNPKKHPDRYQLKITEKGRKILNLLYNG